MPGNRPIDVITDPDRVQSEKYRSGILPITVYQFFIFTKSFGKLPTDFAVPVNFEPYRLQYR